MAGEEGLPFLESAYLSVWTSKWSQSKNGCYHQAITRQPSEIIRQKLTTAFLSTSTFNPFLLNLWSELQKRLWVLLVLVVVLFFNGVVKGRNQPSRTQFMINQTM